MRPPTDIWFRSELDLEGLGRRLGLSNLSLDGEDYWVWVIGGFQDATLDITRTHTLPPRKTDTRIFRYDATKTFDEQLLSDLVSQLHKIGISPIYSGEWINTKGNDFKKEVYATHKVA